MERQLQAWLAPRIAFRIGREERERLVAAANAMDQESQRLQLGYADRVVKVLMREDCDVAFHNLRVSESGGHKGSGGEERKGEPDEGLFSFERTRCQGGGAAHATHVVGENTCRPS